jgi:FkbM family methyltransferase
MTGESRTFDKVKKDSESWQAVEAFRRLQDQLHALPLRERARLQGMFAQTLVADTLQIDTAGGPLSFVVLGPVAAGRAMKLLTKQPGTIQWIDGFLPDSLFWDIGANVGVFALYAARRDDTRVVAFEPAAVNYFLLAANCEANGFADRVDCLLVGLSDGRAVARLDVSQFNPAQSFSVQGKRAPEYAGGQTALLLSMDQLIEEYGMTCPNYIKIDVPGLTSRIIAGGVRMLRRPEVRELHVEMKEQRSTGQDIARLLGDAGFEIAARHTHGDTTDVTFARPS